MTPVDFVDRDGEKGFWRKAVPVAPSAPPETTAPTATEPEKCWRCGETADHFIHGEHPHDLERTRAASRVQHTFRPSPVASSATPRSVVCSTCPPHDKFARPTCQVCYRVANGIDANPPTASSATPTPGPFHDDAVDADYITHARTQYGWEVDTRRDGFTPLGLRATILACRAYTPTGYHAALNVAESRLASSQQEVERLTAANAGLAAMVEELSDALAADPARYEAFIRSKGGK